MKSDTMQCLEYIHSKLNEYYGVVIRLEGREEPNITKRHVLAYVAYNVLPRVSKSDIGRYLHRSHCNVIHSLKVVDDLMNCYDKFKREVEGAIRYVRSCMDIEYECGDVWVLTQHEYKW